jgi:adenylate cyclase
VRFFGITGDAAHSDITHQGDTGMLSKQAPNRLLIAVRWLGLAVAIGLLAFWLGSGVLSKVELAAHDLLFQLRGPLEASDEIVIVAVDDVSFALTDLQWPWPRDYLAQIVDGIAAGNPSVIALDILFLEPTDPAADDALAQAIAEAGNVVVVQSITTENVLQGGYTLAQLNRPIPEIEAAAAATGLVNVPRDDDGRVRRLLAFQKHHDDLYFSWGMQIARLHLGEEDFTVLSRDEVYIGEHPVHLQNQYLLVNYGGPPHSVTYYSAFQVAEGSIDPDVFTDKIVLVGATSESLHDSYPIPYGSEPPMPGVEINAHAINTILTQRFVGQPGLGVPLALGILSALLGLAIVLSLRPLAGLGMVATSIVVCGVLSALVFSRSGLLVPTTVPLLAIGLTYVTGTSINLVIEQRARARMRVLFDRYVSPAAIDKMLDDPEGYLAEQRRHMSILFSDIRGFTSLSEKLTPGGVVAILNEYLSEMTEIIFKYEGTIDKFEGDAILAFFNAPLDIDDHPSKAVRCAIEMIERLTEMQKGWSAKGQHVLYIGIGINTGEAFVGNIGSARRMDYTVIGDTVNLASRLQDLTKQYGVPILFSEATRDLLSDDIETRFIGTERVKGRQQAVNMYTVVFPDTG